MAHNQFVASGNDGENAMEEYDAIDGNQNEEISESGYLYSFHVLFS